MTGVAFDPANIEFSLNNVDQPGILIDHDDVMILPGQAAGDTLTDTAGPTNDHTHEFKLPSGSPKRLHPEPSIFYEARNVPCR